MMDHVENYEEAKRFLKNNMGGAWDKKVDKFIKNVHVLAYTTLYDNTHRSVLRTLALLQKFAFRGIPLHAHFCYGLEVLRQGLRKRALISGLRSLLS